MSAGWAQCPPELEGRLLSQIPQLALAAVGEMGLPPPSLDSGVIPPPGAVSNTPLTSSERLRAADAEGWAGEEAGCACGGRWNR